MVMLGRGLALIIQFIAGATLARLLTPDEFGAFSVASGAASVLYALREFGASNYLVRAEHVDRATVGSVLLASFTLSVLLGGLLALSAGWVADFFHDRRIAPLLYVIAANFLVLPLGLLGNSLLIREERFYHLTLVNAGSGLAGALVMVLLAFAGAGALALAVGATVSSLTFAIFSALVRPRGWALCFAFSKVPDVLRFGGWLTGVGLIGQVAQSLGELVIGKRLGLAAAGLFDKGGSLVRLVGSFASPVIYSVVFARVAAESRRGDDLSQGYLHRLAILSAVAWPAFLFLAIEAGPAIRLVFGPQWDAAVPIAFWLSIQTMFSTPFLLADQVLITRALVSLLFWHRLALFAARLVVLVALSGFGLPLVSAALVLPALLYQWLNQRAVLALIGRGWRDLARALRQPALISAVCALAAWATARWWGGTTVVGMAVEILVAGVATGLAWVLTALLTRGDITGFCRSVLTGVWGEPRRWWALRRTRVVGR